MHQLLHLDLERCAKMIDDGLKHLASLSQMRSLSLNECNISDTGLEALVSLQQLTRFTLSWCTSVTDVGIAHISLSMQNLRQLDLEGCFAITDASLQSISSTLILLEHLNLARCRNITDAGVASLASLFLLTLLNLHCCESITDLGLAALLPALQRLQYFNVSECVKIAFAHGLWYPLPQLRDLNLFGCTCVGDVGLQNCSNSFKNLRQLDICGCPITKRGFSSLFSLQKLHRLRIGRSHGNKGVSSYDVASLKAHFEYLDDVL